VYSVSYADRDYSNCTISCGDDTRIAIHQSVARFKHSFGLDLKSEYIWIEISVLNYISLLIGNPYSLPNTLTRTIKQDLNSLEDILNLHYHVMFLFWGSLMFPVMIGLITFPNETLYYYKQIRGDIHNTACNFNPLQYNYTANLSPYNMVSVNIVLFHQSG
jgi:hypothetical protein